MNEARCWLYSDAITFMFVYLKLLLRIALSTSIRICFLFWNNLPQDGNGVLGFRSNRAFPWRLICFGIALTFEFRALGPAVKTSLVEPSLMCRHQSIFNKPPAITRNGYSKISNGLGCAASSLRARARTLCEIHKLIFMHLVGCNNKFATENQEST